MPASTRAKNQHDEKPGHALLPQIAVSLISVTAGDWRRGAPRANVLFPELERIVTGDIAKSREMILPIKGLAQSASEVEDEASREKYLPIVRKLISRSAVPHLEIDLDEKDSKGSP